MRWQELFVDRVDSRTATERATLAGTFVKAQELYAEPSYYGMLFDERSDDVRFYAALAARIAGDQGASATDVLEYGIGAGRVAIPIARAGHRVHGVDASSEMLAALAVRAGEEPTVVRDRLHWTHGDARETSLGQRFPLVICPFNGLAHHASRDELRAFFTRVREHLSPGGWFAFDVWLPNPRLLAGATTETPVFRDPRSGEAVRCTETFEYEPLTQVLRATLVIRTVARDGPTRTLTLALRQFFPEETLSLLELHGLRVVHRTSRFAPPGETVGDPTIADAPDERGEMLAYVCARM